MAEEKAEQLIVRGSLVTLRRRCGKPNCHCAEGEVHETPALSYSVAGKTRLLTLGPDQVAAVGAALGRYEEARGRLEQRALAGIEALRAAKAAGRKR